MPLLAAFIFIVIKILLYKRFTSPLIFAIDSLVFTITNAVLLL